MERSLTFLIPYVHTELDLAILEKRAGNRAERLVIEKSVWLIERRVIERVEKFSPDLNSKSFLAQILRNHQIPIAGARPVEVVARRISKGAPRWN